MGNTRSMRGGTAVRMKPSFSKGTVKRLLGYIFKDYKKQFFLVLICIIISALAGVAGSVFIQKAIDDYIMPMLKSTDPDFTPLFNAVKVMASIYVAGAFATLFYNRVMVTIAQNVLKNIRDEMFVKMQALPIRYFDTHNHGDVMSHYTNDTDALRQMITQSVPAFFSSGVSIIAVFITMLFTSIYLTAFVIVSVAVMMFVTAKIGGNSGKYFVKQQQSIGSVNGYIEEMINGQKVIKVFCHENAVEQDFDKLNDELYENAYLANKYANSLMPLMGNLGNLQYAMIAVLGGALAISGIGGLTLGRIVAFLQLSKSFTNPVSQISQQINFIVMALAGAERIFKLMDEQPETDEGYVTLVNS